MSRYLRIVWCFLKLGIITIVIEKKYIALILKLIVQSNINLWNNQPFVNAAGENRLRVDYFLDASLADSTHNLIRSSLADMSLEICIDFFESDSDTAADNPGGLMSFGFKLV
jgi:hypothetical protein